MNRTAKTNHLRVAGIGEILWDIFGEEKAIGGAPTNFACHCANLGAEAAIISCLGKDSLGKEAIDFVTHHGINTGALAVSEAHKTGVVNVTLDNKGIPSYEIKEGVAWDHIPMTSETRKMATQLDAVCFGSLSQRSSTSRKSIQAFLKDTPPECLKMFDMNIRQNYYSEELILESLQLASALKLNNEELPLLAGFLNISGTPKEQLKTIQHKFDLKLAILTCGADGALMLSENEESFEIPPVPDEIKSTVGAGDSFTATAVMGFLQNKSLTAINKHANAVASYVCTQTGAVPDLPDALKF